MSQEEHLQLHGKEIIEALSPLVKWKYDDFHKVMLAEFSVDKKDQVLFSLKNLLPNCWDAKSIKKAPPEIKHFAGSFGKLIKEQKLFCSHIDNRPQVMVAWWPWGHGATISARIFLTNTTPYVAKRGFFQKFTGLFA
ncbi:hypothetical protein L0668_09780 [Paraglaciecola aquimarina]|uniref:Uncharacterized protein n=1 Tax=Paraglaciecola algarum TaxID=3050085 RepID=A0ABS9D683_9ALTE|nr:hypothetical protein [Paraglaciecola sp. G1-23]MCF2948395.1 hypothetical protein [Paraglaciecola sp. G1-23]